MKTILTAIDFSEITDAVVKYAIKFAKSYNGSIRLLHIAEPPSAFLGDDVGPQVVRDIKAATIKKEHKQLDTITELMEAEGIEVKSIIIQGSTVEKIIEQSEKANADIIILGSHGKGVIASAIMGSTCQGVIQKSKCPVLVIPYSLSKQKDEY